jgi:hypothetical protein
MKESVFAYRIGEQLFCPDCYEKTAALIPKGSRVFLPGVPLTSRDIPIFACGECERVRKAGEEKPEISSARSKGEGEEAKPELSWEGVIDRIDDQVGFCADKIAFVREFLAKHKVGFNLEIDERAAIGLRVVLAEIMDDLDQFFDDISEVAKRA